MEEDIGDVSDQPKVESSFNEEPNTDNQDCAVVKNDEYSYTKRKEFTSEINKIEIKGLPNKVGYLDLKKLIKKHGLNHVKIKIVDKIRPPIAYVTFSSEQLRDEAISKLDQLNWKSQILKVKKADPIADPFVSKRNAIKNDEEANVNKKRIKIDENLSEEELGNLVNDQITPLWKMPYEEQLEFKYKAVHHFLCNLLKQILKIDRNLGKLAPKLFSWAKTAKQIHNGACCQLEKIKRSPIENGYRNKCEFNVGTDKTVGFRLGLYKSGSMKVAQPPLNSMIISDQMRKGLVMIQKYIKEMSSFQGFNPETNLGHWKQVVIRTTKNYCMIIVFLHPQELSTDEIDQEKNKLTNFLTENLDCGVNSMFIHICRERNKICSSKLEHLYGEKHIYEFIMENNINIRISPLAFFQINTSAAQICYETIGQLANVSSKTIILDLCCGTGTIGLYLAPKVKKVIGIEVVKEAIEDAKENAKINGIENVEYFQGKIEDLLDEKLDNVITQYSGSDIDIDIVAIIDPPRPGLHKNVAQALRKSKNLQRIVYVSCQPELAQRNFIELCRPPSKYYKGDPFVPVKVIPIDMFPHTKHCEVVFLFERLSLQQLE